MIYGLKFRSAGLKDLSKLSPEIAQRIIDKIQLLQDDLNGDVKRLKNFVPKFRLRVGDWRVLFEASASVIQI